MELSTSQQRNVSFGSEFIRIGDLVNLDGPMLTLFEDVETKHLYIFDWVDRCKTANKWLVYQTDPKMVLDFIENKITYFELFDSPVDGCYFFSDITEQMILANSYTIVPLNVVEDKHIPDKNNTFDESDCPHYDVIMQFLIKKFKNLGLRSFNKP